MSGIAVADIAGRQLSGSSLSFLSFYSSVIQSVFHVLLDLRNPEKVRFQIRLL